MNLKKIISPKAYKEKYRSLILDSGKLSYSECGEDLIIDAALRSLKIKKPKYIDIGTNTPKAKNNTYLFYARGAQGVCIEPNPDLFKQIQKVRPRDISLNVGIGSSPQKEAEYYVMTSKALNTFSKADAEKYVTEGNYGTQQMERVLRIPLLSINEILEKYFKDNNDLLSLDTEGYDNQIVRALDFNKYRPKIICVESARYNGTKVVKDTELVEYIQSQGYEVYGDTFVNTILIDRNLV
jgi:FkbM family methyltransferase